MQAQNTSQLELHRLVLPLTVCLLVHKQIQGSELTSHHRHNRVNGDIGGLGQPHAAHMEVDGHLEFAPDAVVFSPCRVLSDDALQSCPN